MGDCFCVFLVHYVLEYIFIWSFCSFTWCDTGINSNLLPTSYIHVFFVDLISWQVQETSLVVPILRIFLPNNKIRKCALKQSAHKFTVEYHAQKLNISFRYMCICLLISRKFMDNYSFVQMLISLNGRRNIQNYSISVKIVE